jgi:hypothetical protein
MGTDGATCAHTLTTETRDIDKTTWDQMRFGMICESSDSFADLKAVIEQLCSISGRCTYQEKQQVENFFIRMSKINERVQALATKKGQNESH